MVKTGSLYLTGLESVPGRDRWTDRITIANTRSQQYLPVQLSYVKSNKSTEYDVIGRYDVSIRA